MPWRLTLTRRAERDLAAIERPIREHLLQVLESAADDPGSVSLAKLAGRKGEWRILTLR